jgi:hypothetical protein
MVWKSHDTLVVPFYSALYGHSSESAFEPFDIRMFVVVVSDSFWSSGRGTEYIGNEETVGGSPTSKPMAYFSRAL